MSNTARIAVPGSGDNGKFAVYNSTSNAWDLALPTGTPGTTWPTVTTGDVGTYATANRTAIQAAITAAEAAGGGIVQLPNGVIQTDTEITIGSRVILRGSGWGTILKLAAGASTTATPKAVLSAEGNTNYIGIEDLYIDGNASNQADTSYSSPGINFYNRGSTESSSAPLYDGGLYLHHVMVYNCQGVGFYVRGDATTMRVTHCYAYHNQSEGFWLKSDCEVANCVAANNGGEGFRAYSGTSIRMTSCKGFGNGFRYNASDFLIHYSESVMMSDCQSEDSRWRGFTFTSVRYFSGSNLVAYRCPPEAAESSAFWVEDDTAGGICTHFYLEGVVRAGGGSGAFAHALTTRELGAQVEIRLKINEEFTGTKWRHLSGASSAKITFGNTGGGTQFPAFAASYTPDQYQGSVVVVTLTGNITVNAPLEPIQGQTLRFIFTQDGTGTRTTTFNAAFKPGTWTPTTTAGKVNVIEFQYNGAAWVKIAEAVNL